MRRAILATLGALLLMPATGHAAFPGQNGKIAYGGGQGCCGYTVDIYTVNPDGSAQTRLTNDIAHDRNPAWSPDGQRILFDKAGGIYVMNADGSGQTALTPQLTDASDPAWSPDAQRIVFVRSATGMWIMDADGTNHVQLGFGGEPAWSPDGQRIAFAGTGGIKSIRPDGTDLRLLASSPPQFAFPVLSAPTWSPDGSRIAFLVLFDNDGETCRALLANSTSGANPAGGQVVYDPGCADEGSFVDNPGWSPDGTRIASGRARRFTISPDGTGFTYVTPVANNLLLAQVDWQPLPVETLNPHARPRGATPFRVPLVPAYSSCTSSNRQHGPPLAYGSCNPPVPGTSRLTIGVGDGSPAFARGEGRLRMDVVIGAPGPPDDSDVNITFRVTNVMRASDLSEYTGELRTELTVRRTDRDPPGAAPHSTSMDFPFEFSIPCTPTPGSSLDASTCTSFTSANAIVPLAVEDTHRAIWELDKVRVYDGGPDEDGDTESGNSLFMTQGLFVP